MTNPWSLGIIDPMTEKQLRTMISETVKETLTVLGIEACNPREMQKDLIFLRGFRRLCGAVGDKVVLVVAGLAATGVVGAVWLAIRCRG